MLVWTDLVYPRGCRRLGIQSQQHPLAISLLHALVFAVKRLGTILDGLILAPVNSSLHWYHLWPVAFSLVFFFFHLLFQCRIRHPGSCSSSLCSAPLGGREAAESLAQLHAPWTGDCRWSSSLVKWNSKMTWWQFCQISCWHAVHGQPYSSSSVPFLACVTVTGWPFSLQSCHFCA